MIQANQGKINMTPLPRQARARRRVQVPPLIESIPGRIWHCNAERLPGLDADFVFATWRGDTGGKPQDELAAMDAVMPSWYGSQRLPNGHYVLAREKTISKFPLPRWG